jgi:serine/threonine-protein kinase
MGTVWNATDTQAREPGEARVALKVMTTWARASDQTRERFRREAALVTGLTGPHFPRVLAQGFERGIPFLVLELLEGETLAARLARTRTLSPEECLSLARNVCTALTQAHSLGVVHRDVSPQNIFMLTAPPGALKVLDFGIAKHVLFESKLTEPGMLMGTPHYMSPEQIKKAHGVDARADIWATAVILYRSLIGKPPFEGKQADVLIRILKDPHTKPSTIAPVGPAVDAFFDRALAKDPSLRYPTASVLCAAFEAAIADLMSSAALRDDPPRPDSLPPDRTALAEDGYEAYAGHASKSRSTPPGGAPAKPSDYPTRYEADPVGSHGTAVMPWPHAPPTSQVLPAGMQQPFVEPPPKRELRIPLPYVIGIVLLTNFLTWLASAHR